MEICNPLDIPVGPILSMKEIAEDSGLEKPALSLRWIIQLEESI